MISSAWRTVIQLRNVLSQKIMIEQSQIRNRRLLRGHFEVASATRQKRFGIKTVGPSTQFEGRRQMMLIGDRNRLWCAGSFREAMKGMP